MAERELGYTLGIPLLTGHSPKALAIRRFIVWFAASALLFFALALLSGRLNLLEAIGITVATAFVIAALVVLLGAFLGLASPTRKE